MEKSQNELYNALVGVFLGVLLSLFLSLVGTLQSGHFSVVAFIVSFMCSSILSIIIGIFVPIKKINSWCVAKINKEPGSIPAKLLCALVDDLIFTPIINLLMVFMAYKRALKFGAVDMPPFGFMLLRAMIFCVVVGFVVLFFAIPLGEKLIKYCIDKVNDEE